MFKTIKQRKPKLYWHIITNKNKKNKENKRLKQENKGKGLRTLCLKTQSSLA